MNFDEVESIFKKWLYLDHDADILRILFAIFLANRYDGLPVWSMLIGKPGCGKSELLGALSDVEETVMVSTLTPNALASGYKDGENSLLHQLKKSKMLIIKDITQQCGEKGLRGKMKIMVGGVPTSQEFANEVGADGWGRDALDSVSKALELVGR